MRCSKTGRLFDDLGGGAPASRSRRPASPSAARAPEATIRRIGNYFDELAPPHSITPSGSTISPDAVSASSRGRWTGRQWTRGRMTDSRVALFQSVRL